MVMAMYGIVTMYGDVCAMYDDVFSTLRCMKMYGVFGVSSMNTMYDDVCAMYDDV